MALRVRATPFHPRESTSRADASSLPAPRLPTLPQDTAVPTSALTAPAPTASTAPGATAPAAAPSLNLPNPRHVARVPAHIGRDQLNRIRQAAYVLPQVVKPGDYIAESSPKLETHLDTLGLVLLQKPVAGARPSRWIEPGLMDSALAHLDAVGTGPTARPLMIERGSTLEAHGVSRHAGQWTRLVSHALPVSGWWA